MGVARPNFLLVVTDQHRADHLGAYGNAMVRTPNIDALSRRGWTADRFYVASPICMPNRATLMTGRMPSVHGVRTNGIALSNRATTFVQVLRDAGYATALVGKAHLQNQTSKPAASRLPGQPAREAWAREPGRLDQESALLWKHHPHQDVDPDFYGFGKTRLVIGHADRAGGHYRRWLEAHHPEVAAVTDSPNAMATPGLALAAIQQAWRTRVPEELYTTNWIAEEVAGTIGDCAAAQQPFFIQCSFPDPHHPFTPPGRYWDMFDPDGIPLPASFGRSRDGLPPHLAALYAEREAGTAVRTTPAMFAATEQQVREAIALNYGSLACIDDAVGKVMAALAQHGVADNTVVMFMSDHGDFLGDHELLLKGPLHYQGLVRTPFIWMDPGAPAAASRRSGALCSTMDVAPTVLARAGVEGYHGIQGRSLLPLMDGGASEVRGNLVIEEESQRAWLGFSKRIRARTLQTGRHRLTVYDGADWGELYDLQEDPHELDNLWGRNAALTSQLTRDLLYSMIELGETSPRATSSA